jgi:hypothetical protein
MHWISLSAAALGREKAAAHQDVLLLARAAASSGAVSFPLSVTHYQETANRRDWTSRRDLATIMLELSRGHAIAPQNTLIEVEIEHGIERFFGVALGAQPIRPFGQGSEHATGRPLPPWEPPPDIQATIPSEVLWNLRRLFETQAEGVLLAGLPPDLEAQARKRAPEWNPTAHLEVGARAAREQDEARAHRRAAGFNKGVNAKNYFAFQAFDEWLSVFNEVLVRARIPPDSLLKLGAAGMTHLLQHIPTLWAASEFRRHRSTSSQAVLVSNDLMDQLALPQAVVYCDIVVTERQHATAFRKLGLAEEHGTVLLHDLSELLPHLV